MADSVIQVDNRVAGQDVPSNDPQRAARTKWWKEIAGVETAWIRKLDQLTDQMKSADIPNEAKRAIATTLLNEGTKYLHEFSSESSQKQDKPV